jgi:AraC family transcriptional regulator
MDVYTLNLPSMMQAMDILRLAHKNGIDPSMDLLYEKGQQIPGSINYQVRRYYAQNPWVAEDTGMMVYHYNAKKPEENYLELRYCTTGNRYCEERSCGMCNQWTTPDSRRISFSFYRYFFTSVCTQCKTEQPQG